MPAGILTPPFPSPTIDPRRDPGWTFNCFVPGKPMPKGSPQPRTLRQGSKSITFMVDRPEVMAWVAKVAGIATRDRVRRVAAGDKSFPYEAPVELQCLFV